MANELNVITKAYYLIQEEGVILLFLLNNNNFIIWVDEKILMIITNALECMPLRDGALGWQPKKQTGVASMCILISITLSQLFASPTGGLWEHINNLTK